MKVAIVDSNQAVVDEAGKPTTPWFTFFHDVWAAVNSADVTGFVPYTGATANVDLGTYSLIANGAQFTGLTASQIVGTDPSKNLTSINYASTNTSSSLVYRDSLGNFSAGTITASLSGNSTTATSLQTGRTISISGDLTYTSPSFDGSTNITAVGTLATVNSNVGSFGSATQVGTFTVDGKGRITAASNVTISGVAPGGSAGGDLSGTYPNPTVAKINGATLGTTTATSGNILIGSGTQWVSNSMSGDVTINSSGVTAIGANKVTNTMLRQSAGLSVIGRSVSTSGNVGDITAVVSGQVLRCSGTSIGFGTIDLTSPFVSTGYTDGQLLIGNSLGSNLVKATLTGTVNQVNIANGGGSITLSLPQNIATSSDVQFSRVGAGAAPTYQIDATSTGTLRSKDFRTNAGAPAGALTNHWNICNTSDALRWAIGLSGSESGSNAGSDLNIYNYTDGASLRSTAIKIMRATNFTGIGNITPLNMLDINGAVAIGSYAGANTAPANSIIVSGGVCVKAAVFANSGVGLQVGNSGGTTCDIAIDGATTSEKAILYYSAGGGKFAVGLPVSSSSYVVSDFGTGNARLTIDSNGNAIIGHTSLSPSATDGFLFIRSGAGTPTGTPTSYFGRVPMYYDSTNDKLFIYNGTWKSVTLT